jgi:peptide/nickel transport system permease protein
MTTLLDQGLPATGAAADEPVISATPRRDRRSPTRHRVLRAAIRAIGVTVPVLFITSFVTFLLGYFAEQKPAELLLGESATVDDVARLNKDLGLDQPVLIQYGRWVVNALQGDLGTSDFT